MDKQTCARPSEPEIGHDVWYRGWECGYNFNAALWCAEGWRAYKGGVDMSYGLRFEPSDNSVRMTDVRVSRFSVEGTPAAMKRPIEKLGPSLAQRVLKDFAVYRLRPEDLQAVEGWGYAPGVFRVVPGGLSITLDPVAR
jgi:hypothetical protein